MLGDLVDKQKFRGTPENDKEMGLNVDFARRYLENFAGKGCYEEVNICSPESLQEEKEKLRLLRRPGYSPKKILSVGIGSGAELISLADIFDSEKTEISGLDISSKTLSTVKERLEKQKLNVNLILGSGLDLPVPKHSLDGIIESSFLHEIYSYIPDGKKALKVAISEVIDKLAEGGLFLLRDFSAPRDIRIELSFKTNFAERFYEYFVQHYRAFESCDVSADNIKKERSSGSEVYPKYSSTHPISISLPQASEFMLHFRNFYENYMTGTVTFEDMNWKEINETYLVPNPDKNSTTPMIKQEYIEMVLNVANEVLRGTELKLICVQDHISERALTAAFLREHFSLSFPDIQTEDRTEKDLFLESTGKMELLFEMIRE